MKTTHSHGLFLPAILMLSLLSNAINAAQEFNLNAIITHAQAKTDPSTLIILIGFWAGFTTPFVEPRLPKKYRKNIPAMIKKELNKNKIKHDNGYFYLSSFVGNVIGSVVANCLKKDSKKSLYISFEYSSEE